MNKKLYLIIGLLVLVIVYLMFIKTNSKIEQQESLAFSLNLNSLNYVLPDYELICIPKKSYHCAGGVDCKEMKSSVFLLVSTRNSEYSRCDSKPCDTYQAEITEGPNFINLKPNGKNSFVRIYKDGRYTENNFLMDDNFTNEGECVTRE